MKMDHDATCSIATQETAARSGTYRLLARLWLREVDGELLRKLRSPPLCDSFVEAGGILPVDEDEDWTIEQLAVDYCRLFVGPTGHLPPCQSVWREGQFQGTTTASMERFVQVVHYNHSASTRGIMWDHLGVQLDVMGHILDQFANGQLKPDHQSLLSELATAFFTRHLLWTTELLEAVAQKATTEFYRSTTRLTREFLDSESQA